MKPFRPGVLLSLVVLLAACGGGAAAPASSAPPASPSAAASAKPAASPSTAASAAASAKPAASAAASAKPAASGASAKPAASGEAKPAASGSAAPSLAPAAPGQIVVAYSEVVGSNTALWAAKEGGIFDKNGLNVDPRLIESSLVVGAVLSGQVPIAAGGGSEAMSAAVEGGDLKVLAITTPVYPYKLEVSKDIQKVEDLKGKKVGVSRIGSSSDIATRIGLRKVGLDPDKDVTIVQLGSLSARTAAIQSGAIQGSMANPPDTLTLEDAGFHPLIDLPSLGLPSSNNGIMTTGAYISGHKAEMQKFMDSMVQSIARIKKDKAFAEQVMAKYLKLDESKADDKRKLDASYDFWVQQSMPNLPYPKAEQFTDSIDILAEKNPKAKDFDLNKLIDPSFVQSAADRGLDKS